MKENLNGWVSHAIVEFESAEAVSRAKDRMRGRWMGTNLLRLVSNEDKGMERFDHRTVVVGNIPQLYNYNDIVEQFSQIGNILRIEMPCVDTRIDALSKKTEQGIARSQVDQDKLFNERRRVLEKYYAFGKETNEFETTIEKLKDLRGKLKTKGD